MHQKPANQPVTLEAFTKLMEDRARPAREQAKRDEEARQQYWHDHAVREAMKARTPATQTSETKPAVAKEESFVDANRKAREARLAMSNQGMSRASQNIAAGLKLSKPARGPAKPAA